MEKRRLSCMKIGETAYIDSIEGFYLERRLSEAGVREGAMIRCVLSAPKIQAYQVAGSLLGIRECDAEHVWIYE